MSKFQSGDKVRAVPTYDSFWRTAPDIGTVVGECEWQDRVEVDFGDWDGGWSDGDGPRSHWFMDDEDLELVPPAFKVGDRVLAKATYDGFNGLRRRPTVGTVVELPGASCPSVTVRFYDWNEGWNLGCSSMDDCWHIRPEDLELAPAALKVGDRVRAKASYHGFSITDRRPDVGTVVVSRDWSADVQFDDWKGGWAYGWGNDEGQPDRWCIDRTDLELANEPAPARDRFLVIAQDDGNEYASRIDAETAAAEMVRVMGDSYFIVQIISATSRDIKIERVA